MNAIRYAAIAIMPLIGGCAFMTAPDSPRIVQLYIEGAGADLVEAPGNGLTLLVTTPDAHPGYGGTQFVYIESDHQLSHYGRHRWADDPGRLIRTALVRALEDSGAFKAVVASPTPALADMRLDLELVKLHQDYRVGDTSELVLGMRATMIALDGRRVIATRSFEFREAAGNGPLAGAAAADRALARMLEAITAFAADATRDHSDFGP